MTKSLCHDQLIFMNNFIKDRTVNRMPAREEGERE